MSGKDLRLRRFFNPESGRVVIFPVDHGVSFGPCPGLERMDRVVERGIRGGADALVMHKGMMRFLDSVSGRLPGIFMHLSASTQLGPAINRKVIVGTVEEAVRRGADGVSVHVNLGEECETEMIRDLGIVGSACAEWEIPLLAMVYVRGLRVPSPVPDAAVAHAARLASELGADIIKIPAPTDDSVLAEITAGSPAAIVVAGGDKVPDSRMLLERVENSLRLGVKGFAIGRNVFQHENPEALMKAVCGIVHRSTPVEEALERMRREPPPVCEGI
ncbi:MAG: 2-amino-3,7-dideoxy-D-threo-hept-6-ulosonate synthase [Acidobacteriota bacterium]